MMQLQFLFVIIACFTRYSKLFRVNTDHGLDFFFLLFFS